MKLIPTAIPEVVIIEPQIYGDDRGWFMESYNEQKFHEGLNRLKLPKPRPFVQDNHSCSQKGVLRGIHFQRAPYAQGKLVRVVCGKAWDVAIDIRLNSSTFGQWVAVELSAENKKIFWIPEGFAHGFVALQDNTHFLYKTTDYYHKEAEDAIKWNDKDLAIQWPQLDEEFIISNKDAVAGSFDDYTAKEKALG